MRLAVAFMLVATSLSGCFLGEMWSDLTRPDISVSRTDLHQTNEFGYITFGTFSVGVSDPEGAFVEIKATASDGRLLEASGHAQGDEHVELLLEDGTWTVTYKVAGHRWETFKDVKVDVTPPQSDGIDAFGEAEGDAYTIGEGYEPEPGVTVEVRDGAGQLLANALPLRVEGLTDGIHVFLVRLRDGAGNEATRTVQVAAGQAKLLPEGQHTFGIVARYTNEARLWDMSDMDAYASIADAQAAVDGRWLGAGHAITPDDPAVQEVVDAEVQPGHDTTMEVAWVLFQWLMEELEYTEERLEQDDLLEPAQTFQNGGGVCRDLAAAYVSLLRAAGVPARLVSGYLGGSVGGFHAWVEFYGGQEWIAVDVSPIDGPFETDIAVQAFAIQLPSYLALRKLPPESEVDGWSTALGMQFSYPSGAPEPQLEFVKDVQDVGGEEGVLCFDPGTLERRLAQRTSECPGMFYIGRDPGDAGRDPFMVSMQRVIDYGVKVHSAPGGSTITMELSYPFPEDVEPDLVEYAPYNHPSGFRFRQHEADPVAGTITGVLER